MASLMTLLVLGLLEGAARLLPDEVSGQREVVLMAPGASETMVASEDVPGWDLQYPEGMLGQYHYTTNHWRMRGPEYPEDKGDNTLRIILTGDSSMFGYGLEWDQTMSAWLEYIYEQRQPGVDVQIANCAAPGHTTVQTIFKLERHCLDFEPDIVVIGNVNSNYTREVASDYERFHLGAYEGPGAALQQLAMYRTLRNAWLRKQMAGSSDQAPEKIAQHNDPGAPKGDVRRVPVDRYEENLHTIIEMSRDAGAQPVILILPNASHVQGSNVPSLGKDEYRDIMRSVAAAEQVPVADGPQRYQNLRYSKQLFMDTVHPGPQGARILGELLDKTLAQNGM